MGKSLASELFEAFVEPAVLGGKTHLLRPIGARVAKTIGSEASTIDPARMREVSIALLAVARSLVPVDALSPPTEDDWTLFAAWHDLYVAAHPDWNQPLRRYLARRVLSHALLTAESVALPETVSEGLTRHVWIAALRSVVRVDQVVTWWTGSESFRGTEPPSRLLALPKLRKVDVNKQQVDSASIAVGSALDEDRYQQVYSLCLALSPLTDLAFAYRTAPAFAWTEGSLAFASTSAGRKLVLRAVRHWPESKANARTLFQSAAESLPTTARAIVEQLVKDLDN